MSETSTSLLDRLRLQPDQQAWQRLVELYTPLIRGWLRRHALLDQDADDVVQEVLSVVVRRLPEFRCGLGAVEF
jgi:RNA polymerase sigma-70 factor (ECF subfamily)